MSILVNTGPTTLTKTWYVDGTATDIGTVTIGIDDADGTEIVATGTSVTDNADGTYEYSLAAQDAVKRLTVTWTSGSQNLVDELEIVGGWLFTESELRAYYKSDLTSATTYPDVNIAEARERIAEAFEEICGVSFVPRYRRQTIAGSGTTVLPVDRPYVTSILSATIGTTTQTVADIAMDDHLPYVFHTTGTWTTATTADPRNVTISYQHGHTAVPGDIKRAAMVLARQQLVKDVTGAGVPETASSWNDGTGQYVSFAANDQTGRWYGIPSVDTALRRYMMRIPLG